MRKIENPIVVPGILSFLEYGTFGSTVKGQNDFPLDQRPQDVELYYSDHIMVGLGTHFMVVMGVAVVVLWRNRLTRTRPVYAANQHSRT